MGSFHERAPDSPSVILTDANGSAIDLDAADNFQDLIFMFGGDRKVKQLVGLETEERSAEQDLAFRADVKRLRQRLRDQRRGLLNPSGFYVQYWDMVTALALMFTLFVTPLEVGVDLTTKLDGLFVVNQCVACIFVCDIVVQFFLPTKMGQHGEYERRHLVLAYAYAKTWLLIDVVSVIPFDILVLIGAVSGPVKVVKLLRVLRLLKLVKVLRASTIIERWESAFAIPSATMSLASWTFAALVALHWFACGWSLLAHLQSSQRGPHDAELAAEIASRMGAGALTGAGNACTGCDPANPSTDRICAMTCLTECEREVLASIHSQASELTSYSSELQYVFNTEHWICRAVDSGLLTREALVPDGAPVAIYGTALLVSMLTLVGGVATVTPSNLPEYFFFFAAILAGTILFAAVQGIICGVVTTGDPDEIQWRQSNDSLNYMMEDCGMEQPMRIKVRIFFRKAKKMLKRRSYEQLVDNCLSDELQGDVRYYISAGFFQKVAWLKDVKRDFLEDLSTKIVRRAYAKGEMIPGDAHLMVIHAGVASRAGIFLMEGAYWGDIILTSARLRDTRPATAVTYVEIGMISRYDLFDVARNFPEAEATLKYEGLRLALERAMVVISAYASSQKQRRRVARASAAEPAEPAGGAPAAAAPSDSNAAPSDAEGLLDPAAVLQQVLHPDPRATWKEPAVARVAELPPEEAMQARADDTFLADFEKTPPAQQVVSLARMMLELTRKMERAETRDGGGPFKPKPASPTPASIPVSPDLSPSKHKPPPVTTGSPGLVAGFFSRRPADATLEA